MLHDSTVRYTKILCFLLLLRDYVNWGVIFVFPVFVSEDRDSGDIDLDSEALREKHNSRSPDPFDSP